MTDVQLASPLDRALSLSIDGEHEAALALAARFVQGEPSNAVGLFVVARALVDLDVTDTGVRAFNLCIKRALRQGNLPLCVAACLELQRAGVPVDDDLRSIAETFAKGSKHLLDRRVPPDMTSTLPETRSFDERGDELIGRVEAVLDACQELLDHDSKHPLEVAPQVPFSSLEAPALTALFRTLEEVTVDTGHVLIEEGAPGNEAYVVARGELQVQRQGRESGAPPVALARLGSGALFGEMALLSRSPRAASVVACRPSVILRISRQALDDVAIAEPSIAATLAQFTRRRMIDNLVRTSTILGAVRSNKRAMLLERFVTRTFEAGEKLITQGAESSGLYLVASGLLSVIHRSGEATSDDDLAISKLGPGEVVGEVALVLRRPSNADVVAEHPTVTLHLPREEFLDLIKAHPEVLAELYELAVKRDEETRSLVAQEATDADEFVLL